RWPPGDGSQSGPDVRRSDIHDVVPEPAKSACAAVVLLVRMQHRHLAGQTTLDAASVVEGLHAEIGDGNAVGVVAMPGKATAAESGLQQLNSVDRPAAAYPIAARSFKTRVRRWS